MKPKQIHPKPILYIRNLQRAANTALCFTASKIQAQYQAHTLTE
jgi:hypothetical protein